MEEVILYSIHSTSNGGQASWEPVSSAPDTHSLCPICIHPLLIRLDRGPSTLALILYQPSVRDIWNENKDT